MKLEPRWVKITHEYICPAIIYLAFTGAMAALMVEAARGETPPEHHWRRAGLACQTPTAWKTEYQVGRQSPIKPWPFECTHALKNVFTEWARREGIWNRKDRGPAPDPEYLFPEG